MFLRRITRRKGSKALSYWALVESYRTARGPRQRVVSYLGELTDTERAGWAALRRRPRLDDPDFIRDLRRYQRESLLFGKGEAVRRWERRVQARTGAEAGAQAA